MAFSNAGAEHAGYNAADIKDGHAEAPSMFAGSLTLHAGETPQRTATCRGEEYFIK